MGLNTFRYVVHVLYPLFIVGPEVDLGHAHNEFLQAALDLGLPGLIAFAALYLVVFGLLWQIWHLPESTVMREGISARALALGLGGGLVAHLVYSLTDAVALGAKPGFMFWMLLGLITALFLQAQSAACAQPQA
jgi:O-antigen ligase